jgi:hypothetical protein
MTAPGRKRVWNPAYHPRDSKGRFTRSATRVMTARDKNRLDGALSKFTFSSTPRGPRAAREYLATIAGPRPDAVNRYRDGDFRSINAALRTGKPTADVADIDAAMQPLPDDLVVTRMVPATLFRHIPMTDLEGMVVRDAAYASTKLGATTLGMKPRQGEVALHIAVPAGTRAVVDPASGEVLLDRDTEMAVTRVVANDDGTFSLYLVAIPKTGAPAIGATRTNATESADVDTADSLPTYILDEVERVAGSMPTTTEGWRDERGYAPSPDLPLLAIYRDALERHRRQLAAMDRQLEGIRGDWERALADLRANPRWQRDTPARKAAETRSINISYRSAIAAVEDNRKQLADSIAETEQRVADIGDPQPQLRPYPTAADLLTKTAPEAWRTHLDEVLTVGSMVNIELDLRIANDPEWRNAKGRTDFGDYQGLRDMRRREQQLLVSLLSTVRPFGTAHHDAAVPVEADNGNLLRRNDLWREHLTIAESCYPDDWINASAAQPMQVGSARRAFYDPNSKTIAFDSAESYTTGAFASGAHQTAVHELAHRMESVIPGLTNLEFALMRKRTTDDTGRVEIPRKLSELTRVGAYADYEVAYPDEWSDPYVGKSYERIRNDDPGTLPWEIMSMGMEGVFGRSADQVADAELSAFVIGALLTLGRQS